MAVTEQSTRDAFFIGGEWVKPATDKRFKVIGANTGEVIGSVPEGSIADIDRAVVAARAAFNGAWGRTSGAERGAIINKFADAIEKRIPEISAAVSSQNGMPISLSSQLEGAYVVGLLRYYANMASTMQFEERRPSPMGFDTLVRREALGVVGGIVPWNYPVVLSILKIGPALVSGCTLVLKPSPGTVLDSYIIAEAAQEAGIPAGVINWVPGEREVGAHLVAHPGINKVAFTGSTAAGRKIAEVCGRLLRPVTLELGGKSAAIILEDAEIAPLLEGMGFASFGNNGQTCAASTRILVPASRYDEIVEAVATMAKSLKVGNSLDPETQIGPMASKRIATWSSATSPPARARPGWSPVAVVRKMSATAGSSSPPCLLTSTTKPPSPRKKSSGRCCPSSSTRTKTTPCASPTTPTSDWAARCGPRTRCTPRTLRAACRPAASASTATCSTSTRRLAASRPAVWVVSWGRNR